MTVEQGCEGCLVEVEEGRLSGMADIARIRKCRGGDFAQLAAPSIFWLVRAFFSCVGNVRLRVVLRYLGTCEKVDGIEDTDQDLLMLFWHLPHAIDKRKRPHLDG